jgi:hypothetical protein
MNFSFFWMSFSLTPILVSWSSRAAQVGSTLLEEKPFSDEKPICATCWKPVGPEIIDLSMPPLGAFFFFAGLELLDAAAALLDLEEDLAATGQVDSGGQLPSLVVIDCRSFQSCSPYLDLPWTFLKKSSASFSSAKEKAIRNWSPSKVWKNLLSWLYCMFS